MLLSNLNLLATAPGGVARLRELILTLAVQGKLVAQDPKDEPASVLLKKIRAEKDQLVAQGKTKRDKPLAGMAEGGRPFGLPQGWEWVQMGALVNASEAGWSPPCIGSPRTHGKWGVLKVSAVSWGSFDPEANKELPGDLMPRPAYEVKDGDFLLSRANTEDLVARSVVVGTAPPLLMLSDKIIRLDVSSQVNRVYLNYCNNSSHARAAYIVSASGTSSSMKNVSREVVLQTRVPLPPLAEQSRIVTRVEELMGLCDALEAKGQLEATQHAQLVSTLLGTLTESETPEELADHWHRVATHFDLLLDRPEAVDALEQTVLQLAVRGLLVPQDPNDEPASEFLEKIRGEKDKLIAEGKIKRDRPLAEISSDERPFEAPIGWEWVRLGDVVLISSGVTLGRKTAMPSPVSLPYVRVANVQRWHLNLSSMKEVVIDNSEIERFKLAGGDLLITEGGDWDKVGRTSIWHNELLTCLHQNHVFKARGTSTDWNPVWAELFLNSSIARTYFASSAKQTTNLASINMTQLKDCVFPVPPVSEQSRIVTRVAHLRSLCNDLRQRLAAAGVRQSQLAQSLVEMQSTTTV